MVFIEVDPYEKPPSEERKKEIENRLWDPSVLRVYCDCSIHPVSLFQGGRLRYQRKVGIAAVFVYDGSVTVKSKACASSKGDGSVYGEMEALLFALSELPAFLESLIVNKPDSVYIYSDLKQFEYFKRLFGIDDRLKDFSPLPVAVEYLGEDKRYNPFYTVAHNAARKSIGIIDNT